VTEPSQSTNSASTRRFGFIGVTATQSSINRVFPRWAEVLDLGTVAFDPVDVPVATDPARYEEVVDRIAADPAHVGALVTTHKFRLLEATQDRFASLDRYAKLLGEISCISKRERGLHGSAKDPLTSGAALDAFVPPGHFGTSRGHVLCLGAGGSGLAITVNLLTREDPADRPERIVLVNRRRERLEECARILSELGVSDAVELVENAAPERNDELMAQLPPGSLVVNATGLGKDRPGSPITERGRFPRRGLAWELNYRGELDFLHQARAQQQERTLTVEDGWTYFIHGWTAVVAEAFDIGIDGPTLERLSEVASEVRG
jgi:shikimate dehydrogenase